MTISTSKQKKINILAKQGLSIPEIVKETSTSYKTAKKCALMSTTSQPQPTVTQQSVITSCSPKSATTKPKKARDTTISYASYENVPYYPPLRIAPPSGRGILTVTDAKPLVPAKPLTKMQKEQEELKNRKGIDVSWVSRENNERRIKNERIEKEKAREIKNEKYYKERDKNIADFKNTLIENERLRDRTVFEQNYPLKPNSGLTESGVRNAVKDAMNVYNEQQRKKAKDYEKLWAKQNNEIYRIRKKQINDKFVADITPSVLDFLDNVRKSVNMISSKSKIYNVQLIKKPMQARVIK